MSDQGFHSILQNQQFVASTLVHYSLLCTIYDYADLWGSSWTLIDFAIFDFKWRILSSWLLKCHSLVSYNGFTLTYLNKKFGVFRFWEIEKSATLRSLRHGDLSSWGAVTFNQGQGHKTSNNIEELILVFYLARKGFILIISFWKKWETIF